MSKPELGVKRDCPECGARFYDLNKEPAHCPKCEHEFVPEALLKPRKTRATEDVAVESKDEAPKPEAETSLEEADNENKATESKRKASLDEEESGDDIDKSLAEFEDVDLDDDEDESEDNSLLVADDDDDDLAAGIVVNKNDDES